LTPLEVGQERFAWRHSNEVAIVLGDALEDDAKELVSFRKVVFTFPEEPEVGQRGCRLAHVDDLWGLEACELLLENLPSVDVLVFG
jgi:hypothetical protein